MWKNSLLYVHDPVNQFHSEENDHHCISTYLSLSTTTLQKFNICVENNNLEKRFQNFLYFINIRKTQMLLCRFFYQVLLYFFPLMNSLIYFDIELGIPHSILYLQTKVEYGKNHFGLSYMENMDNFVAFLQTNNSITHAEFLKSGTILFPSIDQGRI